MKFRIKIILVLLFLSSVTQARFKMPNLPSAPIIGVIPGATMASNTYKQVYFQNNLGYTILPVANTEDFLEDVKWYYQFDSLGTDTRYPVNEIQSSIYTTSIIIKNTCKVYVRALQLNNVDPRVKNNWSPSVPVKVTISSPDLLPPQNIVYGSEVFFGFVGFKAIIENTGGNSVKWYDSPFEGAGTLLHTGDVFAPSSPININNIYVCTYNSTTNRESGRIRLVKVIKNRIIENNILVSNIKSINDIFSLSSTSLITSKTYFDGMSRPVQKVIKNGSLNNKNLIFITEYDAEDRVNKSYSPYAIEDIHSQYRKDGVTEQVAYYQNKYGFDNYPYEINKYEKSSLGRLIEKSNPGEPWKIGSGHTQVNNYILTSTTAHNIRRYRNNSGVIDGSLLFYLKNLQIEESIDENGNKKRIYKDNLGKLLCEANEYTTNVWHYTYYVYDVKSRLSHVIQPEIAGLESFTSDQMDRYMFIYTYDDRDRISTKKIPGKGIEYMVYNDKDQLVFSQDQSMRNQDPLRWKFYKYDALNRQIMSGVTVLSSGTTFSSLKGYVESITNPQNLIESRTNAGFGYTNNSFPVVTEDEIANINFYDEYSTYPTATNFASTTGYNVYISGYLTRSLCKLMDENGSFEESGWSNKYYYYDDRYRVVKTIEEINNKVEVTENTYSFSGNLLTSTKTISSNSTTLLTVQKNFSYDHQQRLLSITESTNSGTPKVLLNNVYDELGNLVKKNYNVVNNKSLYTTDIQYNIRNWQTKLNSYWSNMVNTCNEAQLFDATDILSFLNTETEDMDYYTNLSGESRREDWAAYTAQNFVDYLEDYGMTESHFEEALIPNMPVEGSTMKEKFKVQLSTVIFDELKIYYSNEFNENSFSEVNDVILGLMANIIEVNIYPALTYLQCNDVLTDHNLYYQEMKYNETDNNTATAAQYNGNISSIIWKTSDLAKNEYGYTYDKLNRLVDADYALHTGSGWVNNNNYDVTGLGYDKNGNILTMTQNGKTGTSTFGVVDNLSYTYTGNRLQKVNDAATNSADRADFRYVVSNPPDNGYDGNGNMIVDGNKGLSITYNYLNLPSRVEFADGNFIRYIYDTNGNKRKMIISNLENEGYIGTTTEYMNGVVFEDGAIQYYTNETGRVVKVSGGYETQYVINDHLGNARMTLKADVNNEPVVLQYDSYYPFGLEMGGMSFISGTIENKYKYNGKELQSAHNLGWYDYGARFYDPQLGRWHVVDPLAEKMQSWSVYNYVFNNPIMLVDPDGREPGGPDDDGDQVGLIRNSNASLRNTNPIAADIKDMLHVVASVLGMNTIDNAVATLQDGSSTTGQKISAGVDIAMALPGATPKGSAKLGKTYQTYTKSPLDPSDGVYSGRTSGTNTPQKNIANRDKNHHMNATHGPAVLDKSSKNSNAIRGREQSNINKHGGAKSSGGNSANSINSVSLKNKNAKAYEKAAKKEFGE